jgi:hypothetical protein
MKANQKTWRRLADQRVRHVWKATCDCATKGGTMVGGEVSVPPATVRVPPTFYEASGIPICQECGEDLCYSHTEILPDKPRQSRRQRKV